MSCPDWTSLAVHRKERSGTEPEGWSEALDHFDGGCPLCRKAALKSDPTLVFRRLPAVPASSMTESQERAEVDAVRQAVAAMRAASRLESLETGRRAARGSWKRWSAAAALAVIGLTIPGDDARRTQPVEPQAAIFREGLVYEAMEAPEPVALQAGQDAPLLEGGVNLPGARVYHLSDESLSVTMVVDESIDI